MRILSILALILSAFTIEAAAPNWSVNPGIYNYDMTVTAVLNIKCQELANPSNRIGAFVKGQLRGTALSSTVVNGHYLTLLSVYSNVASGDTVRFKIYNAVTDEIVDAKTYVIFQDDAVYGTPTLPFVIRTNYEPTAINLSSKSITENGGSNVVGNLSAVDSDVSDVHTFSLVSGTGSTDNSSFTISGNQLLTNAAVDFELKNSYKIRLKAEDAQGCSRTDTFTIKVLNGNDTPTNIALSNNELNENSPVLTEIGLFTSTDQDANETFSYTLVSGSGDNDNASFAIQGSKLVVNALLDYEIKNSYSIRVRSTDKSGASVEKQFNVTLKNVNDKPFGLNISVDNIVENNKVGQNIGVFSTDDQDVGEAFTYAFKNIPGNNNDKFFIVGNQLKAAAVFDFENIDAYYIYVSTFDSKGEEFYKLFTIDVVDGNDSPTDITLTSSSVSESRPVGTFIAKLFTTDIDAGQNHIYSLVNGVGSSDNPSFFIRNDSLFTNSIFEVEVKNEYTIRIQTDDQNGATYSEQFDIFVKDINNAPTDIFLDNFTVDEDTKLSSVVGKFTAADADPGDGHSFTLVSGVGGEDNASFLIINGQLKSNTTFDYETKNSYSILVQANDGFGGLFQKAFIIEVTNGNDKPYDIALSTKVVTENKVPGTLIGLLSTSDKDVDDTHSYSFVNASGNNNDAFVINGNQLLTGVKLDFETKNSYFINVRTDDGKGGTFDKQFIITVKDTNDAPTGMEISSSAISENQPVGTVVGVISTIDVDATDKFQYELVSGAGATDNAKFFISNDTLRTNAIFDLTLVQNLKIRIRTTDLGGLSFEKAFEIKVTDENDAPSDIVLSNASIFENNGLGDLIGSFASVDKDPGDAHTYSLVAGAGDQDNSSFLISGNQIKANAVFDYETKNNFNIRVKTKDKLGASFEKSFTIIINNGNDKPDDISINNAIVTENKIQGTLVGLFSTTDKDLSDTYTYSFVDASGTNNDAFVINGNRLLTATKLDFETKNSYFINVRTDDGKGGTFDKQFIITVKDTNDAPIGMEISSSLISEIQPVGTVVGVISTTDVDATDKFQYQLVSGAGAIDNGKFFIVKDTLKTNAVFDLTLVQSLKIRVRTTDLGGLSFEKAFEITVTDANDVPTDISLSNAFVAENNGLGELIASLATVDKDPADKHTYTLVAGDGDQDNASFLISGNQLKTNSIYDFETKSKYSIRVQTNDGFGGTYQEAFVIEITNRNDAPTDLLIDNFLVNENSPVATTIGKFSTEDADAGDSHVYTFVKDDNSDNNKFVIVGNTLKTNSVFDFETRFLYYVVVRTTDKQGATFEKQFTISIKDSNDVPLEVNLSKTEVEEGRPSGTIVANLSTIDPDAGDTHSYTLADGVSDNNDFAISGNKLVTKSEFNYLKKNTYSILVQSEDSKGARVSRTYMINIQDRNNDPTAIVLSDSIVEENSKVGTVVAFLSSLDEDLKDTYTYTLVKGSGDDGNKSFRISGNSLLLNTSADFESKESYSVRIRTTDSGNGIFENYFTIYIQDVNEQPSGVDAEFNFVESSAPETSIGVLEAHDVDQGSEFIYSFADSEIKPFRIDSKTGEVFLTSTVNYEKQMGFTYKVIVKDNGTPQLSDTLTLTINTTDVIEDFLPVNDYVSPNGDGKNDYFEIRNVELYADFTLMIFDVNGQSVYTANSNYNNDWNGMYKDKQLPAGAYMYVFKGKSIDKEYKGTITLVR